MYNNKINFGFMAFAKGTDSTTEVFKRYIGVAPVNIIGVCPSKKKLEEIYNRQIENEITYTGETEVEGKTIKTARVDFIVKTDVDLCGVDLTTKISFFLRNQYRTNKEIPKGISYEDYVKNFLYVLSRNFSKDFSIISIA